MLSKLHLPTDPASLLPLTTLPKSECLADHELLCIVLLSYGSEG